MDKPIAWYDPSNGMVSTDNDCPLFTPLGQVWGLYLKEEAKDEPVKVAHRHEWFRTGEMKVGQMRCISCGTWAEEEMPQRTWVGLTLEEILETYRGPDGSDYVDYARGIEAKLKEKNGC
jgi:hypothetical protein